MAEKEELPIDPETTLRAVCRVCTERMPSALVSGEVVGANDNELYLTLIDEKGNIFTTKVRMSLAESETKSWLNKIELPS